MLKKLIIILLLLFSNIIPISFAQHFIDGQMPDTFLNHDPSANTIEFSPYSPDLNPIEKDFANIKRRWQYNAEKSIQEIINAYK